MRLALAAESEACQARGKVKFRVVALSASVSVGVKGDAQIERVSQDVHTRLEGKPTSQVA